VEEISTGEKKAWEHTEILTRLLRLYIQLGRKQEKKNGE